MNALLVVETVNASLACSSSQPDKALTQEHPQPQESRKKELQQELGRLMTEQISSLEWQSFMGIDEAELRRQEERLSRIREVSGELILAMRNASL